MVWGWAGRAGGREAELGGSGSAIATSSSSSSSETAAEPASESPERGLEVLIRAGGGWGCRRGVERDLLAALRSVMQVSR